jgi:hypothetical protein
MKERKRFKQTETLRERLVQFAKEAREKADSLPSGQEREEMLKKARRADTAAGIDDWANSPGLQPPK